MEASLPTQMYAVAEPRAGQTDSAALAQGMADAVDAAAATCPLPAEPCTNFPEFTAYQLVHPHTAGPSGVQCSRVQLVPATHTNLHIGGA